MAMDADKKKKSTDEHQDRDDLMKRISGMELEYSSFEAHYKELSEYLDPRRGRFFVEDRNKGDKRYKNIINNAASRALRKAVAGKFAGVMSPSRPWFVWSLLNKDLLGPREHKAWLELYRDVVLMVAAKSNLYNMAPLMIRELLVFGTPFMTHVNDFENVARFYTHTVGSFMLATDKKHRINTAVRKYQQTAYNLVAEYGYDSVSQSVQNNYDNGNYHSWHTVYHVLEPNPVYDPSSPFSENLRFRSVYFEEKNKAKGKKEYSAYLKKSGYRVFPGYAPRWMTANEDVYAVESPGMVTLADVKSLQQSERDLMNSIAKAGNPPLQAPPSFRNQPIANLPGGVTSNSAMGGDQKIESLYKLDPRVQEQGWNIERIERRINEGFFTDLFMAITENEGVQPKNELYLSQVNEERLLQIGPGLQQVHGEWLSLMVNRIGEQVLEAGIMPPAPRGLQGKELDIEFVSALAQAQKSVATNAIERTVNFAGAMREMGFEGALDKIDGDHTLDNYADLVGAPAKMIVPTGDAEQMRELRA